MTLRKAIFLDRDGVLNELVQRDGGMYSPRHPEDFRLFPWTVDALSRLSDQGFVLVVITNQPDISRGLMMQSDLDEMHDTLLAQTTIDRVYICPHSDSDNCVCRKPKPGMLLQAASELGLDTGQSWTIGDRTSDLEAGRAAGTRLIYVCGGQEEPPVGEGIVLRSDLSSAALHIVSLDK